MATKQAYNVERFFQALGDRTRLRLLSLMRQRETSVCFLVGVLGESQPKISRHLAILRRVGIVEARREGTRMHYRIVMPPHSGAAKTLRETLVWLKEEKQMRADWDRLI